MKKEEQKDWVPKTRLDKVIKERNEARKSMAILQKQLDEIKANKEIENTNSKKIKVSVLSELYVVI